MRYSKGGRDGYRRHVRRVIGNIPKKDPTIWTTGNNGEITRPTFTMWGEKHNERIGKWHLASEGDRRNGGMIVKMLRKFEMASTKTISRG